MKLKTQIIKKNEPLKNIGNQNEHEKYFHCQKCKSEFVILLFDELPADAQNRFNLILNKFSKYTKAFYFYCPCCHEFSLMYFIKK